MSDQGHSRLVVILYVEGLSEDTEGIFRKYGINTAMKLYKTLRCLLVYPKDKCMVSQTRFRATPVTVHTLEKQPEVMEQKQEVHRKKWNPSATEH